MKLGSLIKPEAVRVLPGVSSKKRLMRDLADLAHDCWGVDANGAVDALQDRENLGPTGVGGGVALPHARLPGLDRVIGLFVRLEKPLPFEAVDRQPVDLVFALFAPEDAGAKHLKALATVSRALRQSKLQDKLRANDEAAVLYEILAEAEETQAA